MFRELLGLRGLLSAIAAAACVMVASEGFSETTLRSNVSEKEMRMLYLWEDMFWIDGAQPANLDRHREIITKLRSGQPVADVGEFAVLGQKIVPGTGALLVKQVFTTDPYPDHYILLEGGGEASQSRFWKLMIYLPQGVLDDGAVVDLGSDSGAFALLTCGTLTDRRWSCFGYSETGKISGIDTKEKKIDLNEKIVVVPKYNEEGAYKEDIPPARILSFHNVLLDVFVDFKMNSSDKSLGCGRPGPVREGIFSQMRFEKRTVDDLPWGGNLAGPLNFEVR